jgi:hypothetical protein
METTTHKSSIADAIEKEVPLPARASARAKPIEPEDKTPPKHVHPTGVREEVIGYDDLGRRQLRAVADRTPTYMVTCKACIADDRKRSLEAPAALDIDHTLFLVPEPAYDNSVARAYVLSRWPEAVNIVSAFHAEKLSYVKGAQIVVITRRGLNGKLPGPSTKRTKDEEGTFHDEPIPPDTYLRECVESAPIVVAECMDVVPATMFSEQSVDMRELVARLAEVAQPYRIAIPADPKDRMYVMRLNS